MTDHDVLKKARAYLLEHGWKQGDYGANGGPRCIVGALGSVCGVPGDTTSEFDSRVRPDEMSLAARVLGDALTEAGLMDLPWALPQWNDRPDRTFAEVILAFDLAIAATAPTAVPEPEPATA